MLRKSVLSLCLLLFFSATVMAEDAAPLPPAEPDAKMLGGMSVLGNQEAPMSLFIVPWKTSELGGETNLTRTLNERDVPVDRDVFMRELEFHQVSVSGSGAHAGAVAQIVTSR